MTDRRLTFVDTNVLFYALDADDESRHAVAVAALESLWAHRTGVVSTQVISELAVNLRKKLTMDWSRIRDIVDPYLAWPVVAIDGADTLRAMTLAHDNTLSYWDSLILVAAAKSGARILLTEDLNAGQVIAGVEIVNPFQ